MVFLKKIFNIVFREETKSKIHKKFKVIFLWIDKKITYREYLKAIKYILRKNILDYNEQDYNYQYNDFLKKIKEEFIRCKIIHSQYDVRDEQMQECIEYTAKNGTDIYCGSLKNIQICSANDIKYDKEHDLLYGMYEGKKLYFDESVKDTKQALNGLNGLLAEQSIKSPHKYLTEDFNIEEGDVVFDVGCADGNFALSVIEKVKAVYLFEIEDIWMKPLRLTFEPYKDKVHIIQKCVTRKSDEMSITLDEFCEKNGIERIGLLKMDVEGYEKDVLLGAQKLLRENRIDKMAICTYHRLNDEKELGAMLPNYNKEMSEGYMLGALLYNIWDIKPPYFTKGLMRARLIQK